MKAKRSVVLHPPKEVFPFFNHLGDEATKAYGEIWVEYKSRNHEKSVIDYPTFVVLP